MDRITEIVITAFGGAFTLGLILRVVLGYLQYGWGPWGMLAWPALPLAVGLLVEANAGTGSGIPAAFAVAGGLVIAGLWRPGYSSLQTKLAFGLIHWIAIGVICGLALVAVSLLENAFNVGATVKQAWPIILATAATYAAEKAYDRYLAWSIQRERQRLMDRIEGCDEQPRRLAVD